MSSQIRFLNLIGHKGADCVCLKANCDDTEYRGESPVISKKIQSAGSDVAIEQFAGAGQGIGYFGINKPVFLQINNVGQEVLPGIGSGHEFFSARSLRVILFQDFQYFILVLSVQLHLISLSADRGQPSSWWLPLVCAVVGCRRPDSSTVEAAAYSAEVLHV